MKGGERWLRHDGMRGYVQLVLPSLSFLNKTFTLRSDIEFVGVVKMLTSISPFDLVMQSQESLLVRLGTNSRTTSSPTKARRPLLLQITLEPIRWNSKHKKLTQIGIKVRLNLPISQDLSHNDSQFSKL